MTHTTKELLVRQVSSCNPDGSGSIVNVEHIEVEIVWPDGKPGPSMGMYTMAGSWVISEKSERR